MWDIVANAALGLGQNLLNYVGVRDANKANMQINRENLAAAYNMQQLQNQYQTDMWNKSNEYNSPAHMRQLYEQAGLNPYMMMSNQPFASAQQQTGSNQSPSSMHAVQPFQADFTQINNAIDRYYSHLQQSKETELIDSQVRHLNFQNEHQLEQFMNEQNHILESTRYTKTQRKQAQFNLAYARAALQYMLTEQHERAQVTKEEAIQVRNENSLFDLKRQLSELNLRLSAAQISSLNAGISEIAQRISNMKTEQKLTNREIDIKIQDLVNKKEQQLGLQLDNAHKRKLNPLIRQEVKRRTYNLDVHDFDLRMPFGIGYRGVTRGPVDEGQAIHLK